MDKLFVSDKHYDEIEEIKTLIEEVETRLYNIKQEKISTDNVYQFLLLFDKLYGNSRFVSCSKMSKNATLQTKGG